MAAFRMIAAGILLALAFGVGIGWQLPSGGRLLRVLAVAWVADVVLVVGWVLATGPKA